MWQRIQTLYIAISTILIGIMFFSVKAVKIDADGNIAEQLKFISYIPYAILIGVIFLLNLLSLITFKIRVFQMRTVILSAIITLALQIWLGLDFFSIKSEYIFRLTAVFPIVAAILNVLAARGILADQLVVESSGRLRSAKRKRQK